MQSISFINQTVSEEKIFKDFFENLSFLGPQQPIKISDQDEGHLKRRALLNKHFSKNKTQISPMRKQKFAISTFFHHKSMGCMRVNIFFRNQILSGYVFSENRLLLVNVLCLECGVNRGEYGSSKTKSLKC